MRLKKYLAGAASSAQLLEKFEPRALQAISRLRSDMPSHVRQVFSSQPSPALLEYLSTQAGPAPKVSDPQSAAHLSRQIPEYARKARRPLQEITVMRSLDVLARHAVTSGQTEYLEHALEGLSGWSPALRQSIARRLPQQLAGLVKARGLCHALQGTKPSSADEPSCLSNLSRFQTDPRIKKLLANKPTWSIAAATSPAPGNSLGDNLLRSALVCVLGAPMSNQERIKYLNLAAQEVSKLDPTKSNYPVSLRNFFSKSNPKDLPGKIQQVSEKFASGWSKLITPKKLLKKQRDYLLVRDKEGNILAHQVTVIETQSKEEKQASPKLGLGPPTTLAKPVPNMPGQLEFNTDNTDMRELINEIALPGDSDVPNLQPGPRRPTGRLKPAAKKKIIPSSSVSGFTESLNHEVSIERHAEDFEVALY